jgi:hypothetical protein
MRATERLMVGNAIILGEDVLEGEVTIGNGSP